MNVDQLIALLLKQDSQAAVYMISAPPFDSADPSIGRYLSKRRIAEVSVQEESDDLCILDREALEYLQETEREEEA